MPDKNDNGTITKFVAEAIWSNFSAHKPAIIPMLPNIKADKKVNKTNTRVEIIFNIEESKVLSDYQKKVLTKKLKTKLVNNCICLAVQEERNQLLNRQIYAYKCGQNPGSC